MKFAQDYEDSSRPEYRDEFFNQRQGVKGLAELLKTDLHDGIEDSQNETKQRQQAYGKNQLKEVKTKSFMQLFLEKLEDPVVIVLVIAAAVRASRKYLFFGGLF